MASRPTRRERRNFPPRAVSALLCAAAVFAGPGAWSEDDQRLVLDNKDVREMYYDEKELKSRTDILETVQKRLDAMEQEASQLESVAADRQRVLDEASGELTEQLEAAKLANQAVEANRRRLEMIKGLQRDFRRDRDESASALERRLVRLYLSQRAFADVPLEAGCQAATVHASVWAPAAKFAAFRYGGAREGVIRAQSELSKTLEVILRQESVGRISSGEAGILETRVAEAKERLDQVEARKRERQASIALLRAHEGPLKEMIAGLEERRALYEARDRESEPPEGDDQRLVMAQDRDEGPPSPVLPSEEPDAEAPSAADEMTPGFDVRTDGSQAIHAAVGGTVKYAGDLRGYSRIVVVQHEGGYYSVYGYLDRLFVVEDERVSPGDVMGLSGPLPTSDGAFGARFEVRRGEAAIDPLSWRQTPQDLEEALLRGEFQP
jgi:septal ring factor EnvC (AmiA/AmiB activator)